MNTNTTTVSWTWADQEAYELLRDAGRIALDTSNDKTPLDSGNQIIELAERIKAQRSASAMQDRT